MNQASIKIKGIPAPDHAIIYLVVIYVVGIVGMLVPEVNPIFIFLVPVNILITVTVVLLYHPNWNLKFLCASVLLYLGGFIIELIGVKTGVIFGLYQYESALGLKILEVPLVMGLNWFLLVYGTTMFVRKFVKGHWVTASFGATLMVLYDLILEPTAIKYGFWKWENSYIPVQNYVAWFICSFIFIYVFSHLVSSKVQNRVGIWSFWLQLVFFACILAGNNLT